MQSSSENLYLDLEILDNKKINLEYWCSLNISRIFDNFFDATLVFQEYSDIERAYLRTQLSWYSLNELFSLNGDMRSTLFNLLKLCTFLNLHMVNSTDGLTEINFQSATPYVFIIPIKHYGFLTGGLTSSLIEKAFNYFLVWLAIQALKELTIPHHNKQISLTDS